MPKNPTTFRRIGLLRLSWPLLVVTFVTLLATLVNVLVLAVASQELNAAVATANQILGLLYDLTVLFSLGGLVVIAQYLGSNNVPAARQASVTLLRATTWLGVAMALFVALAGPIILHLINTPAAVYDDARTYLWIVAGGMAFNAYIVAATAVLRAFGRTINLLILAIAINILDVILLSTFVLVLNWGVVGAALPTLLVRGVGMFILHIMVKQHTNTSLCDSRTPENRPRTSALMARLSVPTVAENAVFNLAVLFAVSLINVFGTDAINARSYLFTLTALVTGVSLAMAQASETIVGWDIGEQNPAHARTLVLRTALGVALAAAFLAVLMWWFAAPLLSFFQPNSQVLSLAKAGLLVSVLLLPLQAVSAIFYGALRSCGDVLRPMICAIAASIVVLVPSSWLFIDVLEWGFVGSLWALVLAEIVKAGLLLWLWLRGTWRKRAPVTQELTAATPTTA